MRASFSLDTIRIIIDMQHYHSEKLQLRMGSQQSGSFLYLAQTNKLMHQPFYCET